MKASVFLYPFLYASGFMLLVLGYPPGPLFLVSGGGLLLAAYWTWYLAIREAPPRTADLGAKGPEEIVEKGPAKPSLGLELKRRLEEE